ncbi:MAG: hypothetical protein KatS3mg105_0064 [Gemmatales bacterium]|nr:MAG: hypothetical protein KatS3mg105_0064 [Gemmatales bacterium]
MRQSLLVEFYNDLPLASEPEANVIQAARLRRALKCFSDRVQARYTDGTLLRLLASSDPHTRCAAVLALGLTGSIKVNATLAKCLHDEDAEVRRLAVDALWTLWFRGGDKEQGMQLRRILRRKDPQQVLEGLHQLIGKCPRFAEAYNQRAIIYFRQGEYAQAIADCEKVLKINPHHFGAASGMAQCYLKLQKPKAALRAFRRALRIHPGLDGVRETVRSLEESLGEEGRRDDRG